MGVGSLQSEEYKKLCALLKQARLDAGLTQQELAKDLGKPQSFVAKYERAERRLDVIEFKKITETIGVLASSLLGEKTG